MPRRETTALHADPLRSPRRLSRSTPNRYSGSSGDLRLRVSAGFSPDFPCSARLAVVRLRDVHRSAVGRPHEALVRPTGPGDQMTPEADANEHPGIEARCAHPRVSLRSCGSDLGGCGCSWISAGRNR